MYIYVIYMLYVKNSFLCVHTHTYTYATNIYIPTLSLIYMFILVCYTCVVCAMLKHVPSHPRTQDDLTLLLTQSRRQPHLLTP